MNQPPPLHPSPLAYASPYVAPPDPRPRAVRVIAIIAIIFGGWGVVAGLTGILPYLGLQTTQNPVVDAIAADKVLRVYMIASLLLHAGLSGIEVTAGIGALTLKPWARRAFIAFAAVNIVLTLGGSVVNLAYLFQRTDAVVRQATRTLPQFNTPVFQSAMHWGMYGGLIAQVLSLAWPAFIVHRMTRPNVKAAFARGMGS